MTKSKFKFITARYRRETPKTRVSDSAPLPCSVNGFIDSLDGKGREDMRQAIQERVSQNEARIQALQAENHQLWAVKITI